MKTLAAPATFVLEVKKSRFLASAAPADTPEAALAFVRAASVPEATHNCWAYRIGAAYRSSDDGEPGGTAGRPILQAIEGQGVDHVVAVVTRWYGGIKLGAGGLARAYGGCAAECLRTAAKVERVTRIALAVTVDFAQIGALHALLASHHGAKLDERYGDGDVTLAVTLPADRRQAFESTLRDATRGRATVSDT